MKVIKKGREQKGYSLVQKCTGKGNGDGGCGAELLVEEKDFYQTQSQARDDTTYYVTFVCPSCGVWTDVQNPTTRAQELARENGKPPSKKSRPNV